MDLPADLDREIDRLTKPISWVKMLPIQQGFVDDEFDSDDDLDLELDRLGSDLQTRPAYRSEQDAGHGW